MVHGSILEEELGRKVREIWIAWARQQPDIDKHPGWLTPYDELTEREKEVDNRIGLGIFEYVIEGIT